MSDVSCTQHCPAAVGGSGLPPRQYGALALLWHSNARLEQSLLEVERGAISLDESAAREEARSLGRLLGLAPGAGSDALEVGP